MDADIVPAAEDSYVLYCVSVDEPAILTALEETTSFEAKIETAKSAIYPKPNCHGY